MKLRIIARFLILFVLLLLFESITRIVWGNPLVFAQIQETLVKGQLLQAQSGDLKSIVKMGPLTVDPVNGLYFRDGNGKAVFLTGSHTWDNRQDLGSNSFDYTQYLLSLRQYNHNFIKLWVWEQPKGITTWPDPAQPNATLTPEIFQRTGPGSAADGGLKFDLTRYNQAHFDRLRQRIIDAGNKGIYVSVMLFDGWSVEQKAGGANPWVYHPFNGNNNINGINGDPNNDQSGAETQTLQLPRVTSLQEAYVRKVIDTVNDLDNVLYEVSNESDAGSAAWQYHMINYIKGYEAGKAKQHPVGMTAEWPGGNNADLFASPADWISPNGDGGYGDVVPAADGKKVVILDTDHIWGIGGDPVWAWKSFTRGYNVLYMDPWNGTFIPVSANEDLRVNMGYILTFAERMNLATMTPRPDLCSTSYCLANPVADGAEYLVYLPNGGAASVNISATLGNLSVEWFNPGNGTTVDGGTVSGGATTSFTAPFNGDSVLYLYSPNIPTSTPTASATATFTNIIQSPTSKNTNTLQPTLVISTKTNTPISVTPTRTNAPAIPTATRTITPPSQPKTVTATFSFPTSTTTSTLAFYTLTFTIPPPSSTSITSTDTTPTQTATISISPTESTLTSTPVPSGSGSSRLLLYLMYILLATAIIGTLVYLLWIFGLIRRSRK